MASIKLVLRQDKINKNTGLAPLYLRIIKDRRAKFLSLSVKLDPKHWDKDKEKVKKNHPNSVRMNTFLAKKVSEAQDKVLEATTKDRNITTNHLKDAVMGKEPIRFFEFSEKRLELMKEQLSYQSYISYKSAFNKLKIYMNNKTLYFQDINVSFLKNYEYYLLHELKNSVSTAGYTIRFIRIMFNQAIKEEIIPSTLYPFRNFSMKTKKSERDYLNEEQFSKLLEFKPTEKQRLAYDMFVFSCYGGGLRFSDLADLKWGNYIEEEQRIVKTIIKTKRKHNFKLPQRAVQIIEKYKKEDSEKEHYIFPCLKKDKNYTETQKYQKISSENSKLNKIIELIGKELELPFKLTFHIARHTFATIALKRGMRIEYVSKILDHTNIKTTQIYAKIVNSELDKAMDNLFD